MTNIVSQTIQTRANYHLGTLRWVLFLSIFTVVGVVAPYLCHQFGIAGKVFLPMHFAVIFAGLVMGVRGGLLVGAVSPIISYATSGMPPAPFLMHITVELMVYGLVAGFVFHTMKRSILTSLVVALFTGRLISLLFVSIFVPSIATSIYLKSIFLVGIPGVVLQILLIPPLVAKTVNYLEKK